MTALLGQHPEVVTYRPFKYEPRVSSYWMGVLRTLSQPKSVSQQIDPDVRAERNWWAGEHRALPIPDVAEDRSVQQWLSIGGLEAVARFCQSQTEHFYQNASADQGKTKVMRFAERSMLWTTDALLFELYPQGHQLFLIRDMRDIACSRIALFDRGIEGFSRTEGSSYEEYIRTTMRREVAMYMNRWKVRHRKALLVRYEDLMRQPQDTLTRLFSGLGIESSPETVRSVLNRAQTLAPERQRQHKTSPGGEASIGRWQLQLDDHLRAACEDSFGEALIEFGYA